MWANQQTNCRYFIIRTYYQPNCPLAFAVCCRCNEDEQQIGWIKESDKEQFLDFAGNVELKDLNVTCRLMKILEEHKAIEVEMKISYQHYKGIDYISSDSYFEKCAILPNTFVY